jgi:DNA polymerase III delta prime subunit
MINDVNPIWNEKYRPRKIADTILPESLKSIFEKFVETGKSPNIILSGRAGVGKTTVAKAMVEELGADYMIINGSMNGNIDTLRNDIQVYASSVSLTGGRKYVILDEADYLNANSTQPALRNFMEEFSNNTSFILTCNFVNRLIEPLQSRCSLIDFKISTADKPILAKQFFQRTLQILEAENVKYDKKVVAEVVNKYFPDWRRTLNELQRYAATGSIDVGILTSFESDRINDLIEHLKSKNFTEARKWIARNSDIDASTFYRKLYDILPSHVSSSSSSASIIMTLAEAQFREAFVADSEINRSAVVASLMSDISDWK